VSGAASSPRVPKKARRSSTTRGPTLFTRSPGEIDGQLELRGLFDGKIARLGAVVLRGIQGLP
jgi:hypothetical protein